MSKIQLVSLAGSLCYLAIILWNVYCKRLKEAYALLWLLFGALMVILSIWTQCLSFLSDLIGIYYPPATLFLLMLAGILLVLFQYSVILSRNQEKISRLTQEIALLKEALEKLEKER